MLVLFLSFINGPIRNDIAKSPKTQFEKFAIWTPMKHSKPSMTSKNHMSTFEELEDPNWKFQPISLQQTLAKSSKHTLSSIQVALDRASTSNSSKSIISI